MKMRCLPSIAMAGHQPEVCTNTACSLGSCIVLKAVLCVEHLPNNAQGHQEGCSPDLTLHRAGLRGRRCGLHLPEGGPDALGSLTPGAAADRAGAVCVSFWQQH